jgi:hypothetical protein
MAKTARKAGGLAQGGRDGLFIFRFHCGLSVAKGNEEERERERERERESEPGWAACVGISYNFFCFVVLGFELGAYTSSHSSSPFVSGIFEIGS